MKNFIKYLLHPFRLLFGRFIIIDNKQDFIFYKAGSFTAGDKIEGDYFEFGCHRGRTFRMT